MKYERSARCSFVENVAIKMKDEEIHTFLCWACSTVFSTNCIMCFDSVTLDDILLLHSFRCFTNGVNGKEPTYQYRRHKISGFHPWVRKIPGEAYGNPFQYSCLENPMDRGIWQTTVQRVTKSRTPQKQLSTYSGANGKETACQCRKVRNMSSIPGSGSPGGEHSNTLQYSCSENPLDRGAS